MAKRGRPTKKSLELKEKNRKRVAKFRSKHRSATVKNVTPALRKKTDDAKISIETILELKAKCPLDTYCKAVRALYGVLSRNYTFKTIAKKLGHSHRYLKKILCGEAKPRIYEKKIIPKKIESFILELAKRPSYDCGSVRKIHKIVRMKFKTAIGRQKIQKIINDAGLKAYRKIPGLIITENFMQKRFDFTREAVVKQRNYFFTDEKFFEVYRNPRKSDFQRLTREEQAIRKIGGVEGSKVLQKLRTPVAKHPTKLMVAGGICVSGKTNLIVLMGSVNKAMYEGVLRFYFPYFKDLKKKTPNLYFMHDNAKPHVSNKVLAEDLFGNVTSWPPNSPDLNPIENLWGMMESLRSYSSKNLGQLLYNIADIWTNIKKEVIKDLCNSFLRRCQDCSYARGGIFLKKNSKSKIKAESITQTKFVNFYDVCAVLYDPDFQLRIKKKHVTLIGKYCEKILVDSAKYVEEKQGTLFELVASKKVDALKKELILVKSILKKSIIHSSLKDYNDSIDEYERQLIFLHGVLPSRFVYMLPEIKKPSNFLNEFKESDVFINAETRANSNKGYFFFNGKALKEEVLYDYLISLFKAKFYDEYFEKIIPLKEVFAFVDSHKGYSFPKIIKPATDYSEILYQGATQTHLNHILPLYYSGRGEIMQPKTRPQYVDKNRNAFKDYVLQEKDKENLSAQSTAIDAINETEYTFKRQPFNNLFEEDNSSANSWESFEQRAYDDVENAKFDLNNVELSNFNDIDIKEEEFDADKEKDAYIKKEFGIEEEEKDFKIEDNAEKDFEKEEDIEIRIENPSKQYIQIDESPIKKPKIKASESEKIKNMTDTEFLMYLKKEF